MAADPGGYETLYRTLAIAQAFVMLVTLVITLIVRTTLKKASWDHKDSELGKRVDGIERTLDRAGQKSSDLANEVQGLPERLTKTFASHDTVALFIAEMRADREGLRRDIADLRQRVDNLFRARP